MKRNTDNTPSVKEPRAKRATKNSGHRKNSPDSNSTLGRRVAHLLNNVATQGRRTSKKGKAYTNRLWRDLAIVIVRGVKIGKQEALFAAFVADPFWKGCKGGRPTQAKIELAPRYLLRAYCGPDETDSKRASDYWAALAPFAVKGITVERLLATIRKAGGLDRLARDNRKSKQSGPDTPPEAPVTEIAPGRKNAVELSGKGRDPVRKKSAAVPASGKGQPKSVISDHGGAPSIDERGSASAMRRLRLPATVIDFSAVPAFRKIKKGQKVWVKMLVGDLASPRPTMTITKIKRS